MSCFFTQHLVLFLLVYADSAYSQVHYYITPSMNVPCPQDHCLTLSQLAADSSSYLGNETKISLSFLPGNHSLDRELSLSQADNFSMAKDIEGSGTVFVECDSQSGRFNISETTFATVQGLHFIGCGGNRVSQVEQFIVEDTIFQGVVGRGTALVLNEVSAASIVRSLFHSNTHSSTFENHDISPYASDQDILNYLYLNRNASLAVGGALYTAFSNVSIVSSQFTHNTAEIGGALFADNSSLHVVGSTYSYNRGSFGGVMITSESSVNIDICNFSKNAAEIIGGVMITYKDSVSISGSGFTNNSATNSGGVMRTLDGSFTITSSTFTNNSATIFGGVMATSGGSFTITRSTFTNNSATSSGGVMYTSGGSFTITRSTFTNNSAATDDGGVVYTFGGSFTITRSTFTNNSATYSGGVMYTSGGSFTITSSTFTNNSATYFGGVILTFDGSFNITSSTFTNNSATYSGVMATSDGSFTITSSTFTNNSATSNGGVMRTFGGSFTITSSTFTNNSATYFGGVMYTSNGSFTITSSTFTNNSATDGGVMATSDGSFTITSSTFTNNSATYSGGVMRTSDGSFTITSSTFTNNSATYGGVMFTPNGSFTITSSTFTNNSATYSGGVMLTFDGSFNITSSTFTNNSATYSGVMLTSDGSFTITSSTFTNNSATQYSGVMATSGGSFTITSSTFTNNSATQYSGVMDTFDGSFTITSSTFTNNSATSSGGVMRTSNGSFTITSSTFTNNNATYGGVMLTFDGSFTITSSTFTNNSATVSGGVMFTPNGSFTITSSTFTNNSATYGGVMFTPNGSFTITSSTFTNNSATYGGVMFTPNGSFTITSSTFTNYSATYDGGVMRTPNGSFTITSSTFTNNSANVGGSVMATSDTYLLIVITNSTFTNNSATSEGGVIFYYAHLRPDRESLNIYNSSFYTNKADGYGGIMFTIGCTTHIADSAFDHNLGSLYIFNSNLTISGYTTFENCAEPSNKTATENVLTRQEGGAITSFQSTVIFTGATSLLNNQARRGGAILSTESKIMIHGETTIANNKATNSNGGGISLYQSDLDIKGNCNISHNHAMRGGGIHATSSTVAVYRPTILQFINNRAENGSGLYLEVNPKLYVLSSSPSSSSDNEYLLIFSGNHASYGGAVYVADDTNSGACSPDNECFIQTLALHSFTTMYWSTINILFSDNTASEQGADLFGGLLDRCIPSPFAEVYLKQRTHYSGVSYLGNISNITALDTISSLPVRICFCNNESEPDCSYQPPPVKVKKGEAFTVSLVAVDQVNHSVDANIISSLSSHDGGFREGQQTQSVERNCTKITFNVFSPHDSETINLFADGPCGSSTPSIRHLDIQFTNCTCPVGFEPFTNGDTRCECNCDPDLSPHITNCNSTTESLVRVNTNSWITYINDTDSPGYVIHPNCPFDYCQPSTKNVSINLNLPNGADAQCAYNHSGILCGECQEHLSLSLGSSSCLPCHSHWPALLVVIVLAAIIAGILLVTVLLALNMTVAVGLINGFIFYANIVAANSAVFFPSSEPSFPTVFVAWLNLDIGVDVCFFDGLDAYTKTWLQLAFPVYIISLVIVVIIVSEYSPRFAGLIGKRDPIATLATLILLSYAKLLSVTITALSFAVLAYPDGSRETVWLPDGNVKYFQGKHIALVIVALLIILIDVPYTILLFLWQWLVRAPKWKAFQWTRNTKLNAFISVHHVPYNSKYRYWTGLLLLMRVVLYITASVTESSKPQVSLLMTIILVGGLLFSKTLARGVVVYKNLLIDVVDSVLYFNLLALSAFSLYHFRTDATKQTAVAYTSTIITFLLLVGVIIYHVSLLVRKNKPLPEVNEYLLAPVEPAETEVTYSIIELLKPCDQPPPLEANNDEVEVKVLTATPTVYQ